MGMGIRIKMAKWIRSYDDEKFENEEAARDAAAESIDIDDIADQIENNLMIYDLIRELERLESPLYFKLLEAASETRFNACYTELKEDD